MSCGDLEGMGYPLASEAIKSLFWRKSMPELSHFIFDEFTLYSAQQKIAITCYICSELNPLVYEEGL